MYSFVLTWLMVKSTGGSLLLRIDDLDRQRMRQEYVEDIFRSLDFVGLQPDEGPSGPQEFESKYSQLHRLPSYELMLSHLRKHGHLFACTCSRSMLQAVGGQEYYTGQCNKLHLPLDAPNTAWRLNTQTDSELEVSEVFGPPQTIKLNQSMPFFVIRKKDGIPAYQIASVCDDEYWHINLIVRGADLLPSTAAQLYLARLTGSSHFTYALFHHHSLIGGQGTQKLSKSAGAYSIKTMREQGISRMELLSRIAGLIGLPAHQYQSLQNMLADYCTTPRAAWLNRIRLAGIMPKN
jgi:glutamyl-tRNA synthetase